MKIWCDVCDKEETTVFCSADEAAHCDICDRQIHHTNKFASKHKRFSLLHPTFKDSPLCDIYQEEQQQMHFVKHMEGMGTEDSLISTSRRDAVLWMLKVNAHYRTSSKICLKNWRVCYLWI
ncbi:hypothetical protein ACFX1R_000683 [Malus domestica]